MKKSTIYNIMAFITFAIAILALSLDFTDKGQFLLILGFVIDVKSEVCKINEKIDG